MTLPSTIVNMKFDKLENDQKEVYFIFLRKDILYQDTYYMFKGTETMFNNSIEQLRAEVAAIQNGSRAYEDELLDTPMDTWTSQDNETVQSHWICYDFNTVEEYEACYDWVCENGVKNASFRRCEIMNI
jgi:hypothetical protein